MSPGAPSERPAGGAEVGDAALRRRAPEAGGRVGALPHHGEAEAGESRARGGQPPGEERGLHRQSGSGSCASTFLAPNDKVHKVAVLLVTSQREQIVIGSETRVVCVRMNVTDID